MTALICKTGTDYEVKQEDIIDWQRTYKDIDVDHELDRMRQWLDANPSKRKTERGMKRFINAWLSRANENVAAGKSTAVRGLKPMGIDNATDVSWLDGDMKTTKAKQYIKTHGSYWDGERKKNFTSAK